LRPTPPGNAGAACRKTQASPDDAALLQKAAALQGSLRRADDAVGMILAALRRAGLERDTIVLYTTDHGVELPRAKWTLLDPGIGVATILRWPGGGLTGGQVCQALTSNVDWLPTFCELAGLPTPPDLDGRSFAAALRDPTAPPHRDELHALFVNGQTYATRTQRYKLLRHFNEGYAEGPAPASGQKPLRPTMQLFDLQEDPDELRDLAGDPAHQQILADMNARFWRWIAAVDDPIRQAPVPTPHFQRALADAPV
jgi:N-sulfoglucosamine sulfohydrolase